MNLIIASCILASFLFPFSLSHAFDNKDTHPKLTEKAIEKSHLSDFLSKQLGITDTDEVLKIKEEENTIAKWLWHGSDKEDEPKCRAANHFHNPLLPWRDAMLTDPSWLADRVCDAGSLFKTKYSNLVWATGYIAPDQRLDPPVNSNPASNGWNWDVARNVKLLTGKLLCANLFT